MKRFHGHVHVDRQPASLAGYLPLAGRKSVGIEPRTCGELKVGAGTLAVGRNLFGPGERIRLWRGDSLQLANNGDAVALFAWDACAQQPSAWVRVRRAATRWARRLLPRAARELASCGNATWCFRP